MSPFGRRQGQQPRMPMVERLNQARSEGRSRLDIFTRAEVDCVTLDPQFLPEEVRGPALQAVSPLLTWVAEESQAGAPASAMSSAAGDLDRRGYLAPGAPPRPSGRVYTEVGGWSADPDGGIKPRPVTIRGDLAIITRARCQPYWVAEISEPLTATSPLPLDQRWRLVARMYTTYLPSTGVVEYPAQPDGSLPACTLLWQDNVVSALLVWAGVDMEEVTYAANPGHVDAVPDGPTEMAARDFDQVRSLRIAHPAGEQVVVRTLVVASAGRRHWLLEGEQAELAVAASVDQIGERIMAAIRPPGGPDGAGG